MRRGIFPPKIICPDTTKIIQRTQLFGALDDARKHAKIIWVAAPGGSGKTTLVASYVKTRQVAHCWYQVDEDDRDLATFFHYLGLAGKLAAPRRKKAAMKLTPEYRKGINAFTRQFIKDISSRLKYDGLIIMDNFQLLVETGPISSLLPNIAESLAPGVSLIILSRHLPPPELTTFSAKRQLSVIDTKMMRFSRSEWLAASQLFNANHSKEALLTLHRKLDGWIAGLVLLPETPEAIFHANTSGLGIEILDSYIADQFLSSLNSETNRLLMRICYMPHITATAARSVSHITHARKLLGNLARKNLFILQQGSKGYTLHPLVREFLKIRARETLSAKQFHDLRLSTALILLNENQYEPAADLLLEMEEWQELSTVITSHAEDLYESGRIGSLQRYINALPEKISRNKPWINFWKGRILVYHDVETALDHYDSAYTAFMKDADIKGIYMSWYSAVSVICTTLLGGNRLSAWVEKYHEFSRIYPQAPQALHEGLIKAALLRSYYCSGLSPKKRESLRVELAGSIDKETNHLLRVHMMSNYVHVAVLSGIKERDRIILDNFENHLDKMRDDPVLHLGALTCCSLGAWSFNNFTKLLDLEQRALKVANESGASVFNCHIYTKIVIAALGLNKSSLARKYINIIKENISEKDQIYQSLYFVCMIKAGTYMDEPADLEKMASHYFHILESTCFPPFVLHTQLLYAYYLCVKKKTSEALELHNEVFRLVEKLAFPGQSSRFYMIYARIYFNMGKLHQCDIYLRKSFAICRRYTLITYTSWHPELMSWACQRALRLGIETTFTRHFIAIHYAALPQPASQCQQWPWPLRIHSFGGFELKIKNGGINPRKGTGKSLILLKTLVKSQNRYLTSKDIKEMLYADDDPEKASQLLDTQLHRLRKLLGNDQAILRQGDSIKLHSKYFWIDTNEFEELAKHTVTRKNALKIASRLQELYKGEYMPDDDSIEVIAYRERYRNMYLATLFKCIDHMEDKTDQAVAFCQNALVLEPLSEPLYRKLILTYIRQGNRDMAEATLGQCRKLLMHHLDSEVSDETLSLLER